MSEIIRSLVQKVFAKLPGLLTVTGGGILGLALWLGATYLFRRQRHRLQPSSHNSTQHCERTRSECLINDVKSTTEENNSWSVASSLSQKKVSSLALSITGVLLHEKSAAELSNKGATPIESSIEVLRELITRLNKKVFLVCEVEDDVGEAVVLDCLDHAGLLGDTMIPRHRIIFCSSNKSKVSIVRQIEPSLYVDVDEEVCQELSRFMNLILVLGENATLEEKLSSL